MRWPIFESKSIPLRHLKAAIGKIIMTTISPDTTDNSDSRLNETCRPRLSVLREHLGDTSETIGMLKLWKEFQQTFPAAMMCPAEKM